ncbi:hypothetical protein RJ639_009586 [Escallonia herrerae]|uniref:Retroviral polymerase SH3-like domain-containing protein n=1 Tax=Escallonia herrerae TaxID=1293975 RepID=A0AA88VXJ8_9ASTE|nr:hypothetical protein RJ639_009586 [Escallonia herrerae]
MKEGTSLSNHLYECNKVISDLKIIDIMIEDENKDLMLLFSLSLSYEHLVTTLLYGKDNRSMEEVEAVINSQGLVSTYRSLVGGKVSMRNDVTCKMVGIGSIHIRMHDGMSQRAMDVLSTQVSIGCNRLQDPEDVWSGEHVNYENLRIIGCPTYAHTNDGKLELSTNKCIFVGYASGIKGYRLWYPGFKSSRVLISRGVTIDESSMLLKNEELIDAGKDHDVREKVKLEV